MWLLGVVIVDWLEGGEISSTKILVQIGYESVFP